MILAAFMALMAYVFYNQTSIKAETKMSYEMPNGANLTLNEGAKIKYNKFLFNLAQNMYVEGEAFVNVPSGKTLGVHTLNGSGISEGDGQFLINADEKILIIKNYKGQLNVESYDFEEAIEAGESLETIKEKPLKKVFNVADKPEWLN